MTHHHRSIPLLLATALAVALAAPSAAAPEPLDPRQVVEAVAEDVIEILKREDLPLDQRQDRIQEIAEARFDFETIGRLVLARYWRQLSETERAEFLEEFKRYLALNYGGRVDRYQDERIEVVGERQEARGDVTVLTRVVGGEADGTEVAYRMRRRDGSWRVIDVVVEGVSGLRSFRSQFQKVLQRGGADGLLRALREKNAEQRTRQAERAGEPAPGSSPSEEAEAGSPGPVEPAQGEPEPAATTAIGELETVRR